MSITTSADRADLYDFDAADAPAGERDKAEFLAATMNVTLAKRVLQWITEHPEQHDQTEWLATTPLDTDGVLSSRAAWDMLVGRAELHTCGTVGCVAGWAVALAAKRARETAIRDSSKVKRLKDALGVDIEDVAARLLFPGGLIMDTYWLFYEVGSQNRRDGNARAARKLRTLIAIAEGRI